MRRALGLCAFCIAAACRPGAAPAPAPLAATPPVVPPRPTAPPPTWVPSSSARRAGGNAKLAKEGIVVVGGLRVSTDGRRVASDTVAGGLTGGVAVPEHLGSGFLFFGSDGLYASRQPLGPLEPLVGVAGGIRSVSFGPGLSFVTAQDERRFAIALPKRTVTPLPTTGLLDVAALPDGRAVFVREPHRIEVRSSDARVQDVTNVVAPLQRVLATPDALWLETDAGPAYRVERDGNLSRFERLPSDVEPPLPSPHPDWPRSAQDPLAQAVHEGLPLGREDALVLARGRVARVDLSNGALLSLGPPVLPPDVDCALLPTADGDDALAACRLKSGGHLVMAGLSRSPTIERSFEGPGHFVSGGDGALAFTGPCRPTSDPGARACVRAPDGTWRELVVDATVAGDADAGADSAAAKRVEPALALRWVPRPDGTALAIVLAPTPGIFDPQARRLREFTKDDWKRYFDEPRSNHRRTEVVDDTLTVTSTGEIRGYARLHAVALERDGSVRVSPYTLSTTVTSGPYALGSDRDGTLWQSRDWGASFRSVSAPPGGVASSSGIAVRGPLRPVRCSRVGCEVGDWFRVGWEDRVPAPVALRVVGPPPSLRGAAVARLACRAAGPARPRVVALAADPHGEPLEVALLGPRRARLRPDEEPLHSLVRLGGDGDRGVRGLWLSEAALTAEEGPAFRAALARPRSADFLPAFAVDTALASARVSWREHLQRAVRLGAGLSLAFQEEIDAVPVLGKAVGRGEGLLVTSDDASLGMWLRAGKAASTFSWRQPDDGGFTVEAAYAMGDALVIQGRDDECATLILRLESDGTAHALERVPARPGAIQCPEASDALAVNGDGQFAVLRAPSGPTPPSVADPALLISARGVQALAPWDTLTPAGAPECAGSDGHRAIVRLFPDWLTAVVPGSRDADVDPWGMALVRWSERRVCLEALEIAAAAAPGLDDELSTHVSVRFVDEPGAARLGLAPGADYFEPLTCSLTR